MASAPRRRRRKIRSFLRHIGQTLLARFSYSCIITPLLMGEFTHHLFYRHEIISNPLSPFRDFNEYDT